MVVKYKTIKELYEACKNGEVDESKLEIILDNDVTNFGMQDDEYDEDGECMAEELCEGKGYYDLLEVYGLLFPKAMVDYC